MSCINQFLHRLHTDLIENFNGAVFVKESDVLLTHSLSSELVRFKLAAFLFMDKDAYLSEIHFTLDCNSGEHACQLYIFPIPMQDLAAKKEKIFAYSILKIPSKTWNSKLFTNTGDTFDEFHQSKLSSSKNFINLIISGFSDSPLKVQTIDWNNFILTEKLNLMLKNHVSSFLEAITP